MKITDLLQETSSHDRAVVSLSIAIISHLRKKYGDAQGRSVIKVGRIGDIFNTPLSILDSVSLELHNSEDINKYNPDLDTKEDPDAITFGVWVPSENMIVMNSDYLSTNKLVTVMSHELRHALDDYISGFRAGSSKRYDMPRKKEHRKVDPYNPDTPYLAKPAEINARFLEVMHRLTSRMNQLSKRKDIDLFDSAINEFKNLLDKEQISQLFPEGTKNRNYRRLFSRGVQFIKHETDYILTKQQK